MTAAPIGASPDSDSVATVNLGVMGTNNGDHGAEEIAEVGMPVVSRALANGDLPRVMSVLRMMLPADDVVAAFLVLLRTDPRIDLC